MAITDLIEELKRKGIEISFSEGKLQYRGPEENITPELIEKLKTNKDVLIKYLWPKDLDILMPINPVGSQVPLFIVHGDNGNYIISEHLGNDQPVYGFFHPGSEGEGIHYRSTEQMASLYLEKVLAVRPSGPYYLLGYSFGGLLAFEMAIQLQKMGNKVPFLAIIDTSAPNCAEPVSWSGNKIKAIRRNILRPLRRRLKHERSVFLCNLRLLMKKPIPVAERHYYMFVKYLKLIRKYKPGKFEGNLLLFRATENPIQDKYLGWKEFVNDIKLVEINGKHLDVFQGKDRNDLLKIEIGKYLDYVNGLS